MKPSDRDIKIARQIRGMFYRGDRKEEIADFFGIDIRRVSDILGNRTYKNCGMLRGRALPKLTDPKQIWYSRGGKEKSEVSSRPHGLLGGQKAPTENTTPPTSPTASPSASPFDEQVDAAMGKIKARMEQMGIETAIHAMIYDVAHVSRLLSYNLSVLSRFFNRTIDSLKENTNGQEDQQPAASKRRGRRKS